MNSFDAWLMDSEVCGECGCILNYWECFICDDCQEDEWYNEDQDYYDSWEDEYETA
jgi:hypothetical protein